MYVNAVHLQWTVKQKVSYKLQFANFYPTALKGCRGVVFTNGVRMGVQAVGKVCPACISETIRCRKLILGIDWLGGCRCATS